MTGRPLESGAVRATALPLALLGALWLGIGISQASSGRRTAVIGLLLLALAAMAGLVSRLRRPRPPGQTPPFAAAGVFGIVCSGVLVFALVGGIRDGDAVFIVAPIIGLIAGAWFLGGVAFSWLRSRIDSKMPDDGSPGAGAGRRR